NTIQDTEDGAAKLNEAMVNGAEEKTIFEKLSELFQTAINDLSDLMLHFQNNIRRSMNSIAILILTNCLMPFLNFFILRWVLKETFHIAIPTPSVRRRTKTEEESDTELVAAGE
ncbi:MAG: hypothetical protein IJ994_02890, partial [Firmicutes bacterium]|nr:hypothetical protein [Bacillota bacterium]